ncbi:RNA 2',3'-cyclic phosphodiesterase [Paludisphaera mucosa]|uniref:RNA 2',3'-cyclic phosphodiesterase n=1 Tax=Paludisphaera mucosa TaxID=3030827 RepID=A0ABT6FCN1_9BACT|nr:RNA 2',3'-cyclic phosphodiesterase [Paludisphaera mucosa]MDG3005322.1 RNA 2',3'-cyclic phosphodiesterase [Paludisphaera mucosa]
MAQTTRTFLAIDVPSAVADRMSKLQRKLAPLAPGFNWVDATPFHMTLAFLGDVPFPELNEVCEAAAKAARGSRRFEVQIAGLGAFPRPDRPRVAWAGFAGPGLEPLAALQKAVVANLRRIGRQPEDTRFTPHVTLGRLKAGRGKAPAAAPDLTALIEQHREWTAGAFTVGEVVAYSSTLTPEGPTYAALARAPLASAKARTDT